MKRTVGSEQAWLESNEEAWLESNEEAWLESNEEAWMESNEEAWLESNVDIANGPYCSQSVELTNASRHAAPASKQFLQEHYVCTLYVVCTLHVS